MSGRTAEDSARLRMPDRSRAAAHYISAPTALDALPHVFHMMTRPDMLRLPIQCLAAAICTSTEMYGAIPTCKRDCSARAATAEGSLALSAILKAGTEPHSVGVGVRDGEVAAGTFQKRDKGHTRPRPCPGRIPAASRPHPFPAASRPHPGRIPAASRLHPGRIPSHPGHVAVASRSHPDRIRGTLPTDLLQPQPRPIMLRLLPRRSDATPV
eukprot:CAMPEP_0119351932 /NCGR_PEP_ID=MMETSP1334-20130426/1219_1 /TAXON_ID=127549 /ORGANISM="Calcidiscus leptoporus, Strain RCC1130" /LENGTH=211 /DNA_ID=CAMNT_0007364849 /DNA_START=128 /DNA_END=765 /DNA_ORIENTATION=-